MQVLVDGCGGRRRFVCCPVAFSVVTVDTIAGTMALCGKGLLLLLQLLLLMRLLAVRRLFVPVCVHFYELCA